MPDGPFLLTTVGCWNSAGRSDYSDCPDGTESEGAMSRKHFRALAEAIAGIENTGERERMTELVGAVCAECNGRFSWFTWRNACNVNRSKV